MPFKDHLKALLPFVVLLILTNSTSAQNSKVAVSDASVSGLLKDSVKNNSLNNATITVYKVANHELLKTRQNNNDGTFSIPNLPTATALEMHIAHSGYKTQIRKITLPTDKKNYHLGTILLQDLGKANSLNTIAVSGAKKNAQNMLGSIKGKLKDSTYRNLITIATVSVYNLIDSNLAQFALPNEFGEFTISKLPVNTPLKLLITHVGYTPYQKIFKLTEDKNVLDLDLIYMNQNAGKENMLNEVKITSLAPVRMNGDTIEFNPRAFKMDGNATAEDLMRRLPGMVIWGDGDITFNGKKINSVLVDGKPFMGGGDITTATQNLPKDVLDKVQIYRQQNDSNLLDSTLHANLKLKEDKKTGYFGKIGAGYGTTNRVAVDAMLSGYTKKLQISTVGAFNNINKSSNSINVLMRSNSYKGEGNNLDYQSDFKRAGINTGTTAGARLQYDFLLDLENKKSRRLIVDYFFHRNNESINSTRLTNTMLRTDSILSNNVINRSTNISANNSLSGKYGHQDKNFDLNISADANIDHHNQVSESIGEQTRTDIVGQLSTSSSVNSSLGDHKRMVIDARFDHHKEPLDDEITGESRNGLLANFSVAYRFEYNDNTGERHNLSSLFSALDPSANRSFDRLYENNGVSKGHHFNVSYPQLKRLIFGSYDLAGIGLDFSNSLNFDQNNIVDMVFDRNANGQQYVRNGQLTNSRNEYRQNIQQRITISKVFLKGLTNRYNRRFDINLVPAVQYYTMQSQATQQTQNFTYQYRKFTPNASLRYNDHQYGDFEISSSLNYNTRVNYPGVDNIAPLIDSTNVWYIPKGNPNIKPEYTNSFSLKIGFESRKPKDPYQINFTLDGNFTNNKISDSTFYDDLGRRINYNVNLDGNKYWHFGAFYRKAYSPNRDHTFRLNMGYGHYNYYVPQYLNAYLLTTVTRNNNFDAEIAYSFLDIVNLNAKQRFSFYKNLQNNNNDEYKGQNNYTRFSGTLQLPKSVTWSTNITFNTNKAQNRSAVNYTIWNASLTYRFMEGNRAEMKFSALDLLKQNKAVINNTNRNVQTFGFDNVLQQYFMISLAYYPRMFGKKGTDAEKE